MQPQPSSRLIVQYAHRAARRNLRTVGDCDIETFPYFRAITQGRQSCCTRESIKVFDCALRNVHLKFLKTIYLLLIGPVATHFFTIGPLL